MKIGIIGYGVVGKAAAATFNGKYDVVYYDKFLDSFEFDDVVEADIIFIMVPTPFDCKESKVDDSAILESLEKLENANYKKPVVIKSTIPPGSCDFYIDKFNLEIIFNPEFLRESTTPNEDFKNQKIVVIGSPSEDMFFFLKDIYLPVIPSDAEFYHLTYKESEMIKYSQNTMLACRVSIANLIYDACIKEGIEYEIIKKIAFDKFDIIGPHMTFVPGPDKKRGFGGKCLPKEIRGFSSIYDSDVLRSIISYNDSLRDDLSNVLKNYKK